MDRPRSQAESRQGSSREAQQSQNLHISDKLLNMLNMIPRKSEHVFNSNPKVLETYFLALRKRLAQRLSNPRLKEIHFHTLRHWKATMLYHKTRDVLYVKEFLGHKRLDSTLKYINI